jgi:PASTA domain
MEAKLILWRWRTRALGAFVVVFALAFALSNAFAFGSPPPTYDGSMYFPAIQSPSDPEDYSWQVELGEEQEMELIDEKTIEVFYAEGHQPAFSIFAEEAHDIDGATVPTSLSILEGNVFTLTVHHLAGNPAKNGASFHYPINAGPALETGFHPPVILGAQTEPKREHCVVPKLRGRSLPAARKLLRSSGCRLGTVRRRLKSAMGSRRVVAQRPKPGVTRRPGAIVDLTLR